MLLELLTERGQRPSASNLAVLSMFVGGEALAPARSRRRYLGRCTLPPTAIRITHTLQTLRLPGSSTPPPHLAAIFDVVYASRSRCPLLPPWFASNFGAPWATAYIPRLSIYMPCSPTHPLISSHLDNPSPPTWSVFSYLPEGSTPRRPRTRSVLGLLCFLPFSAMY